MMLVIMEITLLLPVPSKSFSTMLAQVIWILLSDMSIPILHLDLQQVGMWVNQVG